MATRFNTRMAGHPETRLKDLHGEQITYTPETGDASTPTVLIKRNTTIDIVKRSTGTWIKKECEITVWADDVASPNEDDTVTFDSLTWDVVSVGTKSGGAFTLIVTRTSKIEDSDENYREDLP